MSKEELKVLSDIVQAQCAELNNLPVGNWEANRDAYNQMKGIAKVLKAFGYGIRDNLDGSVTIVPRA